MNVLPSDIAFSDASILYSIPFTNQFSPSYYLSFFMTKNYFVFVQQPLVISVPSLVWGFYVDKKSLMHCSGNQRRKIDFMLSRNKPAAFRITYESEAFAFFHTINSYEEDDHIICDLCCYSDGSIVTLYLDTLQSICEEVENSDFNWYDNEDGKCLLTDIRRYVLPLNISQSNDSENLVRLQNSKAKAIKSENKIVIDYESLVES
ncbi:beta:beta-carotene 9', partial [Dinothrombium tinctorium]